MVRNAPLTLRFVGILILTILSILGLASCSPGTETEVAALPQAVAESTPEAAESDALETAASVPATEVVESATVPDDAVAATGNAAGETNLEVSPVEESAIGAAVAPQSTEQAQAEVVESTAEAVESDAPETAASVPATEAVESPAISDDAVAATGDAAVETDLEVSPVGESSTGEALLATQPTEPAQTDVADFAAVEVSESQQDAAREASVYWKPVVPPEHVAAPSESGAVTPRAFEGTYAACCSGVSVRITICDADDDTAYGRFTSGTSGTSNCTVAFLEDSILLVFDDLSEMMLTIVSPDALMLPDAPCVLHRE